MFLLRQTYANNNNQTRRINMRRELCDIYLYIHFMYIYCLRERERANVIAIYAI